MPDALVLVRCPVHGAAGWIEMTRQTGDRRYAAFALREFWATTDFLYDPRERLYYRDSRFFDRRDGQGRKLFWARGNGWVFAGLARIIPLLPKGSPDRSGWRRCSARWRRG